MTSDGYIKRSARRSIIRAAGGLQYRLARHVRTFIRAGRLYLRNTDGERCSDSPVNDYGVREVYWTDVALWEYLPDKACQVYPAGNDLWEVKT